MAAIIPIILALISYFASKKSGASDGEAALIAAGVGAGSYYVATQTEWGRDLIADLDSWVGLSDDAGDPILDADGEQAMIPPGATVTVDQNGDPVRDGNGNVLWHVVDAAGNVLESWGPAGTAGVIGATSLALSDELPAWVWPVGIVAAVVILAG